MASITTFFRLEPDPLRPDVTVGATAPLHDPLWLLARQWQTGEFAADMQVHLVNDGPVTIPLRMVPTGT